MVACVVCVVDRQEHRGALEHDAQRLPGAWLSPLFPRCCVCVCVTRDVCTPGVCARAHASVVHDAQCSFHAVPDADVVCAGAGRQARAALMYGINVDRLEHSLVLREWRARFNE